MLPNTVKLDLTDIAVFKVTCVKYFRYYNRKYFKNKLPEPEFRNKHPLSDHVGGSVSFKSNQLGTGRFLLMYMNPVLGKKPKAWEIVFLHEMCHIAELAITSKTNSKVNFESHGPSWRYWMYIVGIDPDKYQYLEKGLLDEADPVITDYLQLWSKHKAKRFQPQRPTCAYVSFIGQVGSANPINPELAKAENLQQGLAIFIDEDLGGYFFIGNELKPFRTIEKYYPIVINKKMEGNRLRLKCFEYLSDQHDKSLLDLEQCLIDPTYLGPTKERFIRIINDAD